MPQIYFVFVVRPRWYFWPTGRFARWTYQEDLSVQLARDDLFDQPVQEGLVFHPFHLDLKIWAERRSHYNWLTKNFKIHLLVLKCHEIKIFLPQGKNRCVSEKTSKQFSLKRQWTSLQLIIRVTWRHRLGGKQHDFKWFPLLSSFYPSFWIWWWSTSSVRCVSSRRYGGRVGRVIPYMAYTGMCRWTGYGFCPLCPKQGI